MSYELKRARDVQLFAIIFMLVSLLREGYAEEIPKLEAKDLTKYITMTLKARDGAASGAEVVMEYGTVNPKWSSKCTLRSCAPHTFGVYTDEAVFEFSYTNASLFKFSRPAVRAIRGRSNPFVKDFSVDEDIKAGEISIWHNCSKPTKENLADDFSLVSLNFYIANLFSLRLSWRKTCGGGTEKRSVHSYIDYGYMTEHPQGSEESAAQSLANSISNSIATVIGNNKLVYRVLSKESNVVFGPRVLSTKLYLRLKDGAHSQQFDPPYLHIDYVNNDSSPKSDNEKKTQPSAGKRNVTGNNSKDNERTNGVMTGYDKNKKISLVPSIELRGPVKGGMFRSEIDTVIDVIYTCVGTGVWVIRFTMSIDPFDPIEMSWRKDCGGGVEKGVHVADDPVLDRHYVVQNGMALKAYTRDGGKNGREQRRKWYGTGNRPFYVFVDGRDVEGGIAIGEVSAHSEDENIAVAHINDAAETWPSEFKSITEGGEIVTKSVQRLIRVKIDCLKRGYIRTMVRISIRDRKPIEFLFWNKCYTSKRVKEKQFRTMWWTGVAITSFFVIVTVCLKIFSSYSSKPAVLHSRYRGLTNRFRVVYPHREDRSL